MIEELNVPINNFKWFHLTNPTNNDFLLMEKQFHFTSLLLEDWNRAETLPKHEETMEGDFFILRKFKDEDQTKTLSAKELSLKIALALTDTVAITLCEDNDQLIAKVKNKIINRKGQLKRIHFLFLFLDEVIITFEKPINELQKEYQVFEHDILSKDVQKVSTNRVYIFRRKIFSLKKILKDTERTLIKSAEMWTNDESLFQGIKENIEELYYYLDDLSDNFDSLFQLSVSIKDERANEVMKVLTVFASVMLPLTFVTSFYGMNFYNLPGIHSNEGLYFLIGFMIIIFFLAIIYLYKKNTI